MMKPLTPDERESINEFYLSHFMKPKDAKTLTAVAKLKRDNISYGDAWIQINSPDVNEIVISTANGSEVFLTRRQFQKFVDWWEGK